MSLLREIQDAAINANVDLPTVLRKCKVLSFRLGNNDFKKWVDSELGGYVSKSDVPDYRIMHVNSKGHFSGPFGSGLRNADIPLSCLPEELRENLGTSYVNESAASLEALAKSDLGNAQEPWNPDIVAMFGRHIYNGMNCMQAWKVIPINQIHAIIDSVRNKILNFVLEIEQENPSAGEAEVMTNPVNPEKVAQIFNTYVMGNVQNLATSGKSIKQSASHVGDDVRAKLDEIISTIRSSSVEEDVKEKLADAISDLGNSSDSGDIFKKYNHVMSIISDHMQVIGTVIAPYIPYLTSLIK